MIQTVIKMAVSGLAHRYVIKSVIQMAVSDLILQSSVRGREPRAVALGDCRL